MSNKFRNQLLWQDTYMNIMAAVHADAAAFSYAVYSQGVGNSLEGEEVKEEEINIQLLCESCPCTKDDFIVFAEFSEVTGPVPLLTIPSKVPSCEDVDMNVLIMKIMSIDYQPNPSGQFAFSQDVQVLQHNVLPGRHAYVHYCTLHDLRARGFVRPLCIAYISADHKKLHDNFNILRQKFLAAADILEFNNRQTFINEISKVLANLKQEQNKYFMWKKKEEDGETLTPEEHRAMSRTQLDQLAHQHTELHHMLLAAESLQESEDVRTQLEKWRHALEESLEEECCKYKLRSNQPQAHLTSAASVGPPSLREPLRSVPALSPWGTAAMLWHLLCIQRFHKICRLHTTLSMFLSKSGNDKNEEQDINSTAEALADSEYLQLLQSISLSFQWSYTGSSPSASSPPIEVLHPGSLEYMETNLVTSGNEASSSYHSAPESLSELITGVHLDDEIALDKHSPSLESYIDVPSDSDSSNDPSMDEDDICTLNVWTCCPWKTEIAAASNFAGRKLLRFFQKYPHAAQHVVHSLLVGRTVVLAAGEFSRVKVRGFLIGLSALLPRTPPSVLWWHRGILVSSHVCGHHLIGICVPERLSVHDMISPRDKNSVTILEVSNGRLWGPAYSGQLLKNVENIPISFSEEMLLLHLRSIGDVVREKLFVLKTSSVSVPDMLFKLGFVGCDADILKNLLHVDFNLSNSV